MVHINIKNTVGFKERLLLLKTAFAILSFVSAFLVPQQIFAKQEKISIFATNPTWASLARNLVGKDAQIFVATTHLEDEHYITARPSLLAKIGKSNFVFATGNELEIGWLPLLIQSAGGSEIQVGRLGYFEAVTAVKNLLEVPKKLSRISGDVHPQGNPHVQLNPHNVLDVSRKLAKALQNQFPFAKQTIQKNSVRFQKKLRALIPRWQKKAKPLRRLPVVEYHKHYSYLIDWLNLRSVGSLESKPGVAPTASHLSKMVKIVKQENALLLRTDIVNQKYYKWIAKKTNAKMCNLEIHVKNPNDPEEIFKLFASNLKELLKCRN